MNTQSVLEAGLLEKARDILDGIKALEDDRDFILTPELRLPLRLSKEVIETALAAAEKRLRYAVRGCDMTPDELGVADSQAANRQLLGLAGWDARPPSHGEGRL